MSLLVYKVTNIIAQPHPLSIGGVKQGGGLHLHHSISQRFRGRIRVSSLALQPCYQKEDSFPGYGTN